MAKLLQDISIGDNLRLLRKARGLTQSQVCAQLAVLGRPMLQSNYAHIEAGIRNIYISDLVALKEILHADYEDFFRGLTPVSRYERESE